MNQVILNRRNIKSKKQISQAGKIIKSDSRNQRLSLIKKGIWLYFFLLIFEGALRKWVLPGIATPLLIIRDPIALWLLVICYQRGLFKLNYYIIGMWLVGFVAYFTAIFFGHGNTFVALFGLRILVLHFPLIFLIGQIFDKEDVIKIGKVILWITLPMTILMAFQFYSPQDAWVNRGIAGDTSGAGFSGALGYFRPPGTFSFTNGLTLFYGIAATYIFYFWIASSKFISSGFLIVNIGCLLVAIPLSISRTLFFSIIVTIIFTIIATSSKPKYLYRIIIAAIGGVVLILILNNFSFFQIGLEAFMSRFEVANESEGGAYGVLIDRFLGGMFGAIISADGSLFWGKGIGMGTNVGAMLLKGSSDFLISEGEWGRLIGEMGLLLGLIAIYLRVNLVIKMAIRSFLELRRFNILPWMLLSFALVNILQGQWAQPTALGFATLSGGLVLAAFKKSRKNKEVY